MWHRSRLATSAAPRWARHPCCVAWRTGSFRWPRGLPSRGDYSLFIHLLQMAIGTAPRGHPQPCGRGHPWRAWVRLCGVMCRFTGAEPSANASNGFSEWLQVAASFAL